MPSPLRDHSELECSAFLPPRIVSQNKVTQRGLTLLPYASSGCFMITRMKTLRVHQEPTAESEYFPSITEDMPPTDVAQPT